MRYFDLMEAASSFPTKRFAELFHVGTLNAAHKRIGSYEGAGLSVSLHPEEWREIAELEGAVWRCQRAGNRFLDYVRLSKAQWAVIGDWAVAQGLATRNTIWRVDYHDEEAGEDRFYRFTDRKQATEEAEHLNASRPKAIRGQLVATSALLQRMKQGEHIDSSHVAKTNDLLAIAYAEDVMQIDGVWWNERLSYLSAPRGVIVPSMIPKWQLSPQ